MLLLDEIQVRGQLDADDGRERRDPILVAFAGANDDLVPPEIDVFHPQPSALQESQARTIQQDGHEAGSAAELTDDRPHFVAGSTTGSLTGRLARTTSSSHGKSC